MSAWSEHANIFGDDGLKNIYAGRSVSDFFATAQTMPQNTSVDGDEGTKYYESGDMGSYAVFIVVTTDFLIADGKTFSVKLQHRNGTDSFADLDTIFTYSASGADWEPTAETVLLAGYILPLDTKEDIKAVITTDDVAATGAFDIFVREIDQS